MDAGQIIQLISNVGFPIVMCGALFWYVNKITSQNKETIDELKISINELKTIIANNNSVLSLIYNNFSDNGKHTS